MKVTDEQILQAMWRQQVKNTARGAITTYVGDVKGVNGESSQRYAQGLHMISRRDWGLPLSYGQLLVRARAMIDASSLPWRFDFNKSLVWIDNDLSRQVYDFARQWWRDQGVPEGWDESGNRMRTAKVEDFDAKAAQLERELLERFGSITA